MFIQGCTCGVGDVCSYRAVHVGLVMYVHTGLYMWGWLCMLIQGLTCGAGDVCSYRALHVGLVMYVHTGPYMWGW